MSQTYELDRFPLFLRSGAIIPLDIKGSTTGIGNASMNGKTVFLVVPNGRSSRRLHLPTGNGIDYEDCTVSYDERSGQSKLVGDISREHLFIIWKK